MHNRKDATSEMRTIVRKNHLFDFVLERCAVVNCRKTQTQGPRPARADEHLRWKSWCCWPFAGRFSARTHKGLGKWCLTLEQLKLNCQMQMLGWSSRPSFQAPPRGHSQGVWYWLLSYSFDLSHATKPKGNTDGRNGCCFFLPQIDYCCPLYVGKMRTLDDEVKRLCCRVQLRLQWDFWFFVQKRSEWKAYQ